MKRLLTYLLSALFSLATACGQKTVCHNKDMQNLDSLLASMPVYYAFYSTTACIAEIRINDVRVNFCNPSMANITSCILKSGKNKVSVRLSPKSGKKTIWYDVYPSFVPFKLTIKYEDLMKPNDNYVTVHEMPELRITPGYEPDEGGLPYYEYEAEFEATVPYYIHDKSDEYIDLRQLPNIEKRVVEEYERVRELIVNQKFDQLKEYFAPKFTHESIISNGYNSEEFNFSLMAKYSNCFQQIADYEIVFDNNGRSISLRSQKIKNCPTSALVAIIKQEVESFEYYDIPLSLGIRKGTEQLLPVPFAQSFD